MGVCIIKGKGSGASGSNGYIMPLGAGTRFNLSGYTGYQNFTDYNFRISGISVTTNFGANNNAGVRDQVISANVGARFQIEYTPSTGILTILTSNDSDPLTIETSAGDNSLSCYSTVTIVPYVELVSKTPIRLFETPEPVSAFVKHESPSDVTSDPGWARGTSITRGYASWVIPSGGSIADGHMEVNTTAGGTVTVGCFMGSDVGDSDEVTRKFGQQ